MPLTFTSILCLLRCSTLKSKNVMNRNYFLLFFALILLSCAPSQVLKTSLRVNVLDDLGNPVEGATVVLYANESDFRSSSNPVVAAVQTNNKGVARINDLEAKAYFIDVRKGDKNNFGGGNQIDALEANRLNKINIIIE